MDNTALMEAPVTTRQCLGSIEQVPQGQGLCFVLANGDEVAVFRQRDGQVLATQNRCPHSGGPLSEGIVGGGKVICPLHARAYDLRGSKGQHGCLTTYPVSVEEGRIFIHSGSPAAAACC